VFGLTFGPSRLFRSPAGTMASADFCPVSQHLSVLTVGTPGTPAYRHPDRSPRVRTITFPLRPPRLRNGLVGSDGLRHPRLAHPNHHAFYAVRVPRCRVSSRASFRPRLTATPLPPTRS